MFTNYEQTDNEKNRNIKSRFTDFIASLFVTYSNENTLKLVGINNL